MTISAEMVKKLREATGAGMMECKKALEEAKGNEEEAVTILRKRGQAKAEKRADKTAAEGLVANKLSDDGKLGLIIEVNCETDFVARGQHFKEFVKTLVEQGLSHRVKDVASLLKLSMPGGKLSLEQMRQEVMVKIGENINVRRLALVESPNGMIGSYNHGDRIGVLVALDKKDPDLAKDVAMHIAASNPIAIDKDQVPADLVAKEREIYAAQAQETGKPKEIIDKMVVGRLAKYFQEVCLVNQPFIRNPDQTIESLLKSHQAKVIQFVRFAVGEGIEKESVDFAKEVREQIR